MPCVGAQIAGHLSLVERRDVEIIPPQSPPVSPPGAREESWRGARVEEAGGLGQSGPLLAQTLTPPPPPSGSTLALSMDPPPAPQLNFPCESSFFFLHKTPQSTPRILYLGGNSLGFGGAGTRLLFNLNVYLKLLDCLRTMHATPHQIA